MKHAVILAHPGRKSLNATIAHTYAEAVGALGHDVIVRDLYAMRFDPCLRAAEIPGPRPPVFREDVVAERARLADVDVFAFVYPLWFNAPPAILKGYVDRVFSMGFGFMPVRGVMQPGLTGRQLISFTTSGAPDDWVRETHALGDLMRLFDGHLAGTCGLKALDHVHFGGIVSNLREDVADEIVERVRTTARAHFRAHPHQAA